MTQASSTAAADLRGLLSWFEEHGGSVTKLCLEDLGGEMSLSLLTGQALSKGDVVMSIPISLCMTGESVRRGRSGGGYAGCGTHKLCDLADIERRQNFVPSMTATRDGRAALRVSVVLGPAACSRRTQAL